jgi:hypothetical protein
MRTHLDRALARQDNAIPLLDASSLPAGDDWLLFESIDRFAPVALDFEPDADRFGRFNVSAAYDE